MRRHAPYCKLTMVGVMVGVILVAFLAFSNFSSTVALASDDNNASEEETLVEEPAGQGIVDSEDSASEAPSLEEDEELALEEDEELALEEDEELALEEDGNAESGTDEVSAQSEEMIVGEEQGTSLQAYADSGWEEHTLTYSDGTVETYWRYIESSGAFATGWRKIAANWYYFDLEDGRMFTGARSVGENNYYFDDSGAMRTGWIRDQVPYASWNPYSDDTTIWRYYYSSGKGAEGWTKLGGKWYFFDFTSQMVTNFVWPLGSNPWYRYSDWDASVAQYYLDPNTGVMATGWRLIAPYTIYTIDGYASGTGPSNWYYFNSDGKKATGWVKSGSSWYYMYPEGVNPASLWELNNETVCGAMANGWIEVDGKTYYLLPSGVMVTGWRNVNDEWYFFGGGGDMASSKWVKSGSSWYYMDSDGTMVTGWLDLPGNTYYMGASGAMITGWKKIDGDWYFFNSSGNLARSKWVQKWYYVDADGVMMESGITPDGYRIINGKWDGKGKVA